MISNIQITSIFNLVLSQGSDAMQSRPLCFMKVFHYFLTHHVHLNQQLVD